MFGGKHLPVSWEISCVLTVAGRASVDNPLDRFIRDVCDAGDLMLVDMITASTGNKSYWVARSGGRLSGTGLGRRSNAAAICSGVASVVLLADRWQRSTVPRSVGIGQICTNLCRDPRRAGRCPILTSEKFPRPYCWQPTV